MDDCDHLGFGISTATNDDESQAVGFSGYSDFHTIDWQRDLARDRMRHRHIVKKRRSSPWELIKVKLMIHRQPAGCLTLSIRSYQFQGGLDAVSGWLCVLVVGLVTGFVAGVIDIGATWMTDLKFGICPQAFWLNREQCCWSSNETTFDSGNCSQVSRLVDSPL